MSTTATDRRAPAQDLLLGRSLRLAPWTGIAFVVAFAVGVVASSPPNDNASNAKWMADYTKSHAVGHIVSGVSLLVSGLCFLVFVLGLWQRIAARGTRPNPLPLIGAAVTAACMATGGVFMAMPGVIVNGGAPVPAADLLRFCDEAGFAMVGVPGMLAAAITVIALGVQARKAGVFGQKLFIYSIVVSIALLGAVEFLPIAFLLLWLIIAAVTQLRQKTRTDLRAPAAA
jgi:hypothetical protein